MTNKWMNRYRRMSGLASDAEYAPMLGISRPAPGQSYPQHYPYQGAQGSDPLGTPLTIQGAARLIGCSAWTVRQSYIPQGLPHLRSGPSGKLIFYREQVVRWILEHQQKGGTHI